MNEVITPARRPHGALADRWTERLPNEAAPTESDWLARLRSRAADAFREHGLPGNRDEAWKYTSLGRLEALDPRLVEGGAAVPATEEPEASYPPPLPGVEGFGFRWCGGRQAVWEGSTPEGVTLMTFGDAVAGRGPVPGIETRLREMVHAVDLAGRSRAFHALNTAMLGDGVVLHVASGVDAGDCLARLTLPRGAVSGLHNLRVVVLLEDNARLRLIERFGSGDRGAAGTGQALNLFTQAELSEGARLDHVRIQTEAEDAVVLTFTDVRQERSSHYRHAVFDTGGALVRHAIDCRLEGEGAHAAVLGALVADGERHIDYHIAVDHQSPGTTSEQFVRGVLGGRSRGVFNGKAVIRPGADGSRVRQSNANLLLSRAAEMDTKPELEIYADEVEASHGATVGQLDERVVFYLRSRGLSEDAARRMLTAAFCREVAERLDDQRLSGPIAELLEAAMPRQDAE